MNPLVILTAQEQEYLLRIIEAAAPVRELHQLFLWSQGQLQALLPHKLMLCMQFDADGAVQRVEALHGSVIDAGTLAQLCELALGKARACHASGALPCVVQLDGSYDNLILHGSGAVAGSATVFALFGLPTRPDARQAHFLTLLLPHLHLALLRLARPAPAPTRRPISAREADVIRYLREGKRNAEIAAELGISAFTVKNHLQRIYKVLEVRNRTEAVARAIV
ncbi:MAG: LuxR C-terminal-related transcriptional regulator [Pseudomonadota bacterium]